jgi:hypothetical protein
VKMVPDWPSGWIYVASSLAALNRPHEAYETLSAGRFFWEREFMRELRIAHDRT